MHAYHLVMDMEERGYVRMGRFKTGSIYTILNRMEKHGLLLSKQEESESGRTRRVYSATSKGRTALKVGLEHMLRRKKILDELSDYYTRHFQNKKPSD
jgi:DNA-binding PadR family transcriptional regulator